MSVSMDWDRALSYLSDDDRAFVESHQAGNLDRLDWEFETRPFMVVVKGTRYESAEDADRMNAIIRRMPGEWYGSLEEWLMSKV